jgi:putative transposase
MAERGGPSDHATIQRWVVKSRPLWAEALHRRKHPGWVSWRMDETDLKVRGQWDDLSRAVAKQGQTMDVGLTAHRDQAAALRFLKQAIRRHGVPETSTLDGSEAKAAAMKSDKQEHGTASAIRQVKSCNTLVEQAQRGVQWGTRPRRGGTSFAAAQDTWVGIELMPMIKQRQLVVEEGDEGRAAAALCYSLAASSLDRQGQLPLHDLLTKICDTTVELP